MKRDNWQNFRILGDDRPYLSVYDYLSEKRSHNSNNKEQFEKKEGKRVIIIDMVDPEPSVCQIDLQ